MTQICIQTDRKPGRQQVSGGHRGYCLAPGSTPCSHFHRLFLCGWVKGCRLMKGVWTTKKSGSHLADTPAHLWPSESSHHDRPPHPRLRCSISPHVGPPSPGSDHVVWLPGHCQTRLTHGGIKQRRGKEKERRGEGIFKWGDFVWDENVLFMQKASVVVLGRVKEDYEAGLQGRCRSLIRSLFLTRAAPFRTDHTVTRLQICWWI